MVLVQFVITYDDVLGQASIVKNGSTIISATSGQSSYLFPITVNRIVNLNSGSYYCKIVGLEIASGGVNTTTFAFQPQILSLNSTCFSFAGQGSRGIQFSNNGQYCQSDIKGEKTFLMNIGQGNIDLTLSISQFGTFTVGQATYPWVFSKDQSWLTSQFAFFILTLECENCNNQALFGNTKLN
jgi:hypothetical protein